MNSLIEALAPVLVASFALQQLIELLDPVLETILGDKKGWVLSLVSLGIGLMLAFGMGLRVLEPLGNERWPVLDGVLTALFLTGGTKWLNDLLKLISYKKQEIKARAALARAESRRSGPPAL